MARVPYLTPDEIARNKEQIQKSLVEQGASPVVRSGQALAVTREFVPNPGTTLLDSGPGAGVYLQSLHEAGYTDLHAVDIDNYLVAQGVKELRKADLSFDTLPWPDGSFTVVTAWQLVEHLENPHKFIREVHRLLRPDGLFILSMPNIQHVYNRIFFLVKGDMTRWHAWNNHIALFPKGLFAKAFLKYFTIVETRFTRGEFPYRKIKRYRFPSNEWFGRDVIYVLKKIV